MTNFKDVSIDSANQGQSLTALSLAALGVVYGDIGTSPLYTLKECFGAHTHLAPTVANVSGILSLIFWSIIFVVTLKYISFVLKADNKGEGGIMALLSLVPADQRRIVGTRVGWVTVLVLIGASLLFGLSVYGLNEAVPELLTIAEAGKVAIILGAMIAGGIVISGLFTILALNKFINMKSNKIYLY